jgi:hypothetical protein
MPVPRPNYSCYDLTYLLPAPDGGRTDIVMMSRALRAPVAGDVTVEVVLRGEIDITAVPALSRYLARVLERGPSTLVVDLAGVRFLDCAAAWVIVGTGGMLPDGQRPVLRRPAR